MGLLDEKESAFLAAAELTTAGIKKIILLTHVGYSKDLDWLVQIPNVDVIVGGDSHSLLGSDENLAPIGFPEGPYPTTQTSSDGRTVCVVQAWEYAYGVGKLDVEFDLEGNVLSCSGMTHIPYDAEKFEPELTTEEKEAVVEYLDGFGGVFVPVIEDEAAASALKEYQDGLEEIKTTVIATVPEGICFERIPGQGRSLICSPEETSAQGGGVCNLVAQAFMEQALTADFAIQNGGGCRTDIFAGDFTIDNAYSFASVLQHVGSP